jgi:amidase
MGSLGVETTTTTLSTLRLDYDKVAPSTAVLEKPRWQDVAKRRREELYDVIPKDYLVSPALLKGKIFTSLPATCGILSQRELGITSLTASSLLKLIHKGAYTAVEVTKAFCKRAAIAHQAVRLSLGTFCDRC